MIVCCNTSQVLDICLQQGLILHSKKECVVCISYDDFWKLYTLEMHIWTKWNLKLNELGVCVH